jgi:cell division inhibitor SepF
MSRTLMDRLFGGWGRYPREDPDEWAEDDHIGDADHHEELEPPPSIRAQIGAASLYRAEPRKLDEAEVIADRMKQGNPVVVSLENADATEAQRIRDFLGGVSYALGGYIRKVAARVYACAPANMPIEAVQPERQGRADGTSGAAAPSHGRGGDVWPE